MRSHNLRRDVI